MKFALAIAALAAGAAAFPGEKRGDKPHGNYTVVTETYTALTTYCPEATTLTYGQSTYTVTAATTLTITACPNTCTRTSTIPAPPPATYSQAPPPAPTPYPTNNATATVAPTTPPVGTGSVTASATVSRFTGAAAKYAGSGALAGLAGLAMMAL